MICFLFVIFRFVYGLYKEDGESDLLEIDEFKNNKNIFV